MMRALDCVSPNGFKISPTESTEVFVVTSMAGSRRDLESHSNSNITEKKHSIWWNVFIDVPLFALVLALVGLFEFGIIPTKKSGFFCNDPKLSYKYLGDTVNEATLVSTVLLLPLLAVILTELGLLHSEYHSSRIVEVLRRSGQHYRTYAYGFIFNFVIVEFMKGISGMPRPLFFDLCAPNTGVNCTTGEFIPTFECTSSYSWWKQNDSSRSFPSGHTSMSVYCGLFIAWYLQRRAFSWSSRSVLLVPFIQLCCAAYAALCSLSRITDHRHHWWDVAVGAVVGVTTLVFAVLVIGANFASVRRAAVSIKQPSTDLLYDTSRRRPAS